MIRRGLLAVLACAVVTGLAGGAHAAVCVATASGVSFASYDPLLSTANTSTGTVTVTCTSVAIGGETVAYGIGLSTGLSGTFNPRQLQLLSKVNYNLYTTAALTVVWGDGSGATGTMSDGYRFGPGIVARSYTVYGAISAGQNVAAGGYADVIVVTVSY